MNHSWNTPLKDWQTADPVIFYKQVEADLPWISTVELEQVFPMKGHSLKTWGRAGEGGVHNFRTKSTTLEMDPHWIGVHKQTGLHTDPSYPRYSHHLIIRTDRFSLLGMSRMELPIERGLFYILDGHSPHQLAALDKQSRWYLAVSVDSPTPLDADTVIPALIDYAHNAPFLP